MSGKAVFCGKGLGFAAVLLAGVAGTAMAKPFNPDDATPVDVSVMDLGPGKGFGLQNTYGQPFYTYDKDTLGKSTCLAKCAEIWVPLYASEQHPKDIDKTWTLITRPDGSEQWTYNGQPLYTFGYGAELAPPTTADLQGHWHVFAP